MVARGNSRRAGDKMSLGKGALLAGAALCAIVVSVPTVRAQVTPESLGANVSVPEGAQLFLEADTVSYESENAIVTASGGVQIDYGDYQLVARQIVYDQNSRRLVAAGGVELIEPSGNRIYADQIDITDNFADGFVQALRIETPDNTRFAAAEAVRQNGSVTTFERGVYTACEACRENPERPPLWQVKAKRIVWDQEEQVVRYYGAQFELWGLPLAYLPYFATPDPTVQRRSGFLAPELRQSDDLGFGVRVPYFIDIADDRDVTLAGTYYSKQGFLGEAEYRQATDDGYFTLQTAGILQRDPDAFDDFRFDGFFNETVDIEEARGMIGTTGRFALNDRWTFGWDILAQTDSNFSNVYDIENFNQIYRSSEVYLTGLGEQSFFDLRGQAFDVQTENVFTDEVQPNVLPSLDYNHVLADPIAGGEVQLDVNVTALRRDTTSASLLLLCEPAFFNEGLCDTSAGFPYRGDIFRRDVLEGDYARGTTEASWRRTYTTSGGLLVTPSFSARGDLYGADMSIADFTIPNTTTSFGGAVVDEAGARGMASAAIEARYPFLIETANTSHVIEPIGQLIVRPNEGKSGLLPNEDAQSLVFSTANLFSQDKFSGYDRIEGGTRANVGVRYSGVMGAGFVVDAAAGQSFHLAGENPFASQDLALIGYDSGLETDRSDYVSSVALTTPYGITIGAQGRFDEESLDVQRADLMSSVDFGRLTGSMMYSRIAEQPIYGFAEDREQTTAAARFQVTDEITTFGSISFDIENTKVIERTFGVGYADECFSLIAEYRNTSDRYQLESSQSQVMFRLSLRTLAETGVNFDVGDGF